MTAYLHTISLHWHDGTRLTEDYVVDGELILTAGTIAPGHYVRDAAILGVEGAGVVVESASAPTAAQLTARANALLDLIADPSLFEVRLTVTEWLGPELGAPGAPLHYVTVRR